MVLSVRGNGVLCFPPCPPHRLWLSSCAFEKSCSTSLWEVPLNLSNPSSEVLLELSAGPTSAGSSPAAAKAGRAGGAAQDWQRKYLTVKAEFSAPLKGLSECNCLEQGEIRRKWKLFTFWTCFQLQGRTDGGTHSKEAFVGLGFHLQLLAQTSHLSQLQSSYDRVIILIGRQNKKALRQTNEVNCAAAGASWRHFVGNEFTQLQIQQNLWKYQYFPKFPPPRLILNFNPV